MKPRLVAHGGEDADGRALLLISALHHASDALAGCEIRFIGVRDADVGAALAALRWDAGLDARPVPEGEEGAALSGARLFAAILGRGEMDRLAPFVACGVPSLVAVQFPDPARHGPEVFALQRAAHDPALLARHLLSRLNLR
jgi:hypothetical protein